MKEQREILHKRVRRTPINGTRNVLTVSEKDPDFHYRFVNDTGDRVARFQELGYEVVTDQKHKLGDRRVAATTPEGSTRTVSAGGGVTAVLMRQRKEWYDEDQKAKADDIDETERAMKGEALAGEGRYGKIEVGRKIT